MVSDPADESDSAYRPEAGGLALSGFRAVFKIRSFRSLFWGQAISALGDWVGTLAFIVAADRLSHGKPLAVTAVLVLRLIPTFFATPIGGVLSDRWDRKRIMIGSDLARFVLIFATPFVPYLWALYLFAFAHESFSLVFLPARDASIPNVVGPDDLEAANALVMGSSFAGIPLSGPIFAILAWAGSHYPLWLHLEHVFRARPYSFAFVFDAFTFLVSAAAISHMSLPKHIHTDADDQPFFASAREGVVFIRRTPLLRSLAYAVTMGMLGGGVLFALGIGYIHHTLRGNDVTFGWLMGLFGAGMLVGFLVSQIKTEHGFVWMLRVSIFITGAVLIVMAVITKLWLAYMMAVVFGAAFSVDVIVAMSRAQAMTADDIRGRVMGVVHMLVRGALVGGALASAVIGQVFRGGLNTFGAHSDANQVALLIAGSLIAIGAVGVRTASR